ncbi:hypothetical protein TYRP_014893 [Tyrophagus putrescentiae]|nr:hypothetical protein TYRP_014893 [Tyrophagus putrescentiae]
MAPQLKTEEKNIICSAKPGYQYPNISVAEYIANQVTQIDGSVPAIVNPSDDTLLTYEDFHKQAQQFASALLSFGAVQGNLVVFFAENSAQLVVAFFGAVYLGLPICPLPPSNGPYELTNYIRDASGAILVFGSDKRETILKACNDPKYSKTMAQLKILIQLETEEDLLEHEILSAAVVKSFTSALNNFKTTSTLPSIPYFTPVDLKKSHFCLCFTSGTTGSPKAAVHSNRSFLAMLMKTQMGEKDKREHVLQWHPLGHMSGLFMIFHCIYSGKSVVLHRSGHLESLLASVEKYKLVYMPISASHATQMLAKDYPKQFNLSSLMLVVHAGSKVAPNVVNQLMERYGVICLDVYAATECMAAVGDRKWPDWMATFQCGNLGTVNANVELKDSVFVGYLNNEAATKATIDEDGWYHSGDIGYVNEAGDLFYVDRIKEMIKYRLYSVIPAEIEDFLYGVEGVEGVCVVGVPDSVDGELVRAYVQLKKGAQVTEKQLIDAVAENMGNQKQLRGGVHFVPIMPRTMIGKVDRQYFKNLAKQK